MPPPPGPSATAAVWNLAGFGACVVAFLVFGTVVGYRVFGIVMLGHAAYACTMRSVPVNIRGRAPSLHITGWGAVCIGLVVATIGTLMLLYPAEVAEVFATGRSGRQS